MAFVVINVFTPIIIFGEGLCALLCSYLLSNILSLCQEKQEAAECSMANAANEMAEPSTTTGCKEHESI